MASSRGPAALLRELRGIADKGWPAGLVVLSGDSAFHVDEAQRIILSALVAPDADDYAMTVYGDEKVEVGTVVSACRSAGMFSERRVVLVRDLELLSGEPEGLLDYASNPPSASHLVIRAPKLDRRRKLGKSLAKLKMFYEFKTPQDPTAVAPEIIELASQQGLELPRDAANMLAHVCGGDLQRASVEIQKVGAWLGGKSKRIRVQDLRETVAGEGALSGWELANAIADRNRKGALCAARMLIEAGEEPIRIVGGIAWQARKMLASKDTRRYELRELLTFPSYLLEADRSLKSRPMPGITVLENLVDRMVGTD